MNEVCRKMLTVVQSVVLNVGTLPGWTMNDFKTPRSCAAALAFKKSVRGIARRALRRYRTWTTGRL